LKVPRLPPRFELGHVLYFNAASENACGTFFDFSSSPLSLVRNAWSFTRMCDAVAVFFGPKRLAKKFICTAVDRE
jgi:hypothetical protein